MEDNKNVTFREEVPLEHENNEDSIEETITISLKSKKNKILSTLKDNRSKNIKDMLLLLMWCVFLGAIICINIFVWTRPKVLSMIVCCIFGIISYIGIICLLNSLYKNHKTKVNSKFELSLIEDDIFLEEIKGLSNEEKALKQLSKKQADIERYHSLNLAHTKIIFIIGVVIIFIGISIIAFTIISTFLHKNTVQTLEIVSGFIGGLLVDAVGAVFILMYTKTIESANKFQSNMVETAKTYLGNVLVSQITDTNVREQTLSTMAKELVQADKNDDK